MEEHAGLPYLGGNMKYYCVHCKKCWNHPVEKCIFCGHVITRVKETCFKVIGYSEVFIPSTGNEKIPYFVNLLEDKQGHKIFQKSFHRYNIGEIIDLQVDMIQNYQIGIVGSGMMGVQLAAYMIQNKFPTVLKTRSEDRIKAVQLKIQKIISKRMSEEEVKKCLQNLTISTDYNALKNCDLIIEAVAEDINLKKEIFKDLSKICKSSAIFSTNSSSLSIDDLAGMTDRPEKCIGMHFFNPVHRMNLVEIIIGHATSGKTKDKITDLVLAINKKPIIVKNSPGYVVNRLLLPQINEAIFTLEEGIATKEDIDSAVKLGLNHPMGPFELADFIGLDICLSIINVLYKKFDDSKYRPSQLLITMVEQGKLGFKSGQGFYNYGDD
ncbi:MAG: 3-hydroxyacyl-CoA dehydrogenase NAD-binding domain-containing protein [Methanoregula sp.]